MDEKRIELDDVANEVIMLTQTTVDRLFEISTDAYVLYSFLYKTAKWQNNNKVWATKSYIEKKLKWGNKRVIAAKKQLIENGFIETVVERDETGRISRWKIRLKYLKKSKITTGVESNRWSQQPVVAATGRQGDPIELDNNNGELDNNNGELNNNKNIYTPRGEKKSWGEFGNVKLTDDEYEKLVKIYGLDDKVDFAIKVLDCYLENNPDAKSRYKSHYAAMQVGTWIYDKTEKDWFPTKPRIFDPEKDFVPAKPLITLE